MVTTLFIRSSISSWSLTYSSPLSLTSFWDVSVLIYCATIAAVRLGLDPDSSWARARTSRRYSQNKTTFATKDRRLTKTIFKVQLEVFRTNCQKADMAMFFHVSSNVDFVFSTTWQNVRIIHFGHGGPQDMARNMVLLMHVSCIRTTTDPGCLVTHQNVLGALGIAPKPFAAIVTP